MTYNIESELYKKFFQLFTNDADGKYMNSSVSPKIDEDELDEETHDDPNVLDQNLKNDINELKEFIKDGIKNGSIEVGYLNYSYITQQIYSGDTVKNNSFEFITKLKKNYLDKSDESKVIFKLLRHTDLALVQKASLSDKIVELESRVKKEVEKSGNLTKELEDTTKKLENIAKKWEEELNDTKEEMKKIMPEIIGIMGVFSTIIFAVFSGFNEITTLGQSLSSTPISKVMIYIGSSFIVLIGIVFISYFSIGKFFNKNLKSCGCKTNDNCEHDLIEKYPSILVFVWLGISFIAIGAMLMLFRDYINLPKLIFLKVNLVMYLLLFLLLLIPFGGLYYIFNKRICSIFNQIKSKDTTNNQTS